MSTISLSDWIEAIRTDLEAGVRRAAERDPTANSLNLKLQQITLEVSVVSERTASGGGGIKFWVVEANGKTSEKNAETQKLTITMQAEHDTILGTPD
jgi:hypothetical protein